MTQALSPAAPQMLVSNVVQLVNESDQPFRMKYGPTNVLELGPHGSADPVSGSPTDRLFVNEEVAWHFLGRWWTDNNNPRQRDRAIEYQRLRTLYGAYEDDLMWQASRAFSLKAYAPDGQPIVTVVDDPEGTISGAQTPFGREMSLESQLEVMRQTMQQMSAELEAQKRRSVDQGQPDVPADTPQMPVAQYNPAAPPPPLPSVAGVPVPTAPAAFGVPGIDPAGNAMIDPDADELGQFGAALPVWSAVAYDPSEAEVPEDAPEVVKVTPTGGRVTPE